MITYGDLPRRTGDIERRLSRLEMLFALVIFLNVIYHLRLW